MDQETLAFANEHFSVKASRKEGCRLFVEVFISPSFVQKSYSKAVKIVNKQISVPGFRKGHAPNQVVVGRHPSYVDQEWREILIQEGYRSALELSQIYPLNRESLSKPKLERYSQEEGAFLSFSYECYPQIPEIDLTKLSIPSIEKETISQKRIDEVLEDIRRTSADWEDVQGRGIEEGDFVDLSIDSIEGEEPQSLVKDRRFEITDKSLAPWLKKLVMGLKVGESIEGQSEVDPEATKSVKKNFKSTKVRITLHAIKKIILPLVDEELAKKVGASSLEDLHNKIQHNLEKEAEESCLNKKIDALDRALLAAYSFDLPASLVEAERKARLENRIKSLKEADISDEELKQSQNEIEKEISQELDQDLRLFFLEKQLEKQGSISLSNQELNDELLRYLNQNPYLFKNETDQSRISEIVTRVRSRLLQRKAKDYALAHVKVS